MKGKFRIGKINKAVWQIALAVLMLGMGIFFIKNEHLELLEIRNTIHHINRFYLWLGIAVTCLYILLQGLLYVFSFKAVDIRIGLKLSMVLFLKRNVISVFLPAGGFSSLAFFNKPLRAKGVNENDIYYGSSIFGFISLLSVFVFAIPVFIYLFLKDKLTLNELLPFSGLVIIILLFIFLAWSLVKKRGVYRLIVRFYPEISLMVDNIISTRVHKRHFLTALLVSVFIEFTGVAHIYISMLALGFQPTLFIAVITYLVMVMLLVASPFLRGLGAIEVSMTYLFIRDGIPAAGAAAITLVFRFFEFWLPLLTGVASFIFSKRNILVRVLPAFIIFATGLINIISVATPAIPSRLALLNDFIPQLAISISNFSVVLIGIILVILAYYLLRGVRRAWRISLFLLAISALGHIVKGIDYEEAGIALFAIASLLYTREYYTVKAIPLLQTRLGKIWGVALLGSVLFSVFGTYFLEHLHMGADYNLVKSFQAAFRLLFLFDSSFYNPLTGFGTSFIIVVTIFGAILWISGLLLIFRPVFFPEEENHGEEQRDHARLLAEKYGQSALDYFKYYNDKRLFFKDDGFVAYKTYKNYAVVLEIPVAKTEEQVCSLLDAFEDFAEENGLSTFYYRVSEKSVEWFTKRKKKSIYIGQEAILHLETFSLSGKKMHPIRNAISKANREGYTFKAYEPPIKAGILQKLEQVSDDWLETPGKTESAFSQGVFLRDELRQSPVYVVENAEEEIVAFLNRIPDYTPGEATYDLIRINKNAPTGVIYLLLISFFEEMKKQGVERINLGLVAFAGIDNPKNMTERAMKFALENLKPLNHLKGQYMFKDKFKPEWVNKYLIYDSDYDLINFPAVLKAVSKFE